jgi:hypothetical protein
MTLLTLSLVLIQLAGLIVLFFSCRHAADGHEDETGFHFQAGLRPVKIKPVEAANRLPSSLHVPKLV